MAENDWAIVIGINAYEFLPTDEHLKYAVNDAVKVRQFLCEQARFPQENVLLCCDNAPESFLQQRPRRNALRHLLRNEIQRAQGANNFWFFYAGHGIVHEHQDFLLPCDGNPRDLKETAIPISFVTDCLKDCGAANVVLVMDMCRNRTQGIDEGARAVGEEMGEQTQQIAKAEGIVTLFSCSRGERSYEIKDLEQGAFTYALLEGLQQGTTPRALEHYLTQRVPTLNRHYGKKIQTPRVIPEPGFKYDLPLLLSCATPSADIQQLAVEARDAEEAQDYEKAKALWWQMIGADRFTQSDRKMAMDAIARIDKKIKDKESTVYEQRLAEEVRKKEEERQLELERQQELERQRQEKFKQERQELPSEKLVFYTLLRDLLEAQDWRRAEQETYKVMLEAVGKRDSVMNMRLYRLTSEELLNFPCTDLKTIDRLWLKYSNGHFGFSIQQEIYTECGAKLNGKYAGDKIWQRFGDRIGWRKDSKWLPYAELNPSLSSPRAMFPLAIFITFYGPWFVRDSLDGRNVLRAGGGGKEFASLAKRLVDCSG
jgi:uncharacterized caspase-like protein